MGDAFRGAGGGKKGVRPGAEPVLKNAASGCYIAVQTQDKSRSPRKQERMSTSLKEASSGLIRTGFEFGFGLAWMRAALPLATPESGANSRPRKRPHRTVFRAWALSKQERNWAADFRGAGRHEKREGVLVWGG